MVAASRRTWVHKGIACILALAILLPVFGSFYSQEAKAATLNTLTVDMTAEKHDIVHGAAGFLYGVSNEDVPTTNTLVPLKPKILATKGALGTEHPYGDALDVAKTFLESGGEQVQMYNSNYYGVFGVTADYRDYSEVLKTIIAPAVVEWKAAWNEEHGTPEAPKDNIGKRINIDEAIVYIPINEGTPIVNAPGNNQNQRFSAAFESYYKAIKAADPDASVAGPNCWGYNGTVNYEFFLQYCMENDCLPEVYTWHELSKGNLREIEGHVAEFRGWWQKYVADKGGPQDVQIVINEYAEMIDCGVPGRLVNWIARLEDEQVYGCLPFWHQANNLNDLTADANEGNGAWWVYKWYGDMSGRTLEVESNTSYDALYGLATIDDAKQSATVLLGGVDGEANVVLENVAGTATFAGADRVHVKVQSTSFTGFHGAQSDVPTILEGTYPVNVDGTVTINLRNMKFATAYNVTVTKAGPDEQVGDPIVSRFQKVYEAEDALLEDGAEAVGHGAINPVYYFSGDRAVRMTQGAAITYTVDVPADGLYQLTYNYGNGTGTLRNDHVNNNPRNVAQSYSYDSGGAETVMMKNTLLPNMTGTYTEYKDLAAGQHTIKITTTGEGTVYHDMLTVTYSGAYGEAKPGFDTVYEAEQADFNTLVDNTHSQVKTQTTLPGYSGNGYVTGLGDVSVPGGGGIRWNVIVEESGLYNATLRYQSGQAGALNLYVGNTTATLNRLASSLEAPATAEGWQTTTATLYLQKGINIVDADATMDAALDYMRVQAVDAALVPEEYQSIRIEAEDAIPSEATQIQTAQSSGASGGLYVLGLEGAADAASDPDKYLEFTVDVERGGQYQLQVLQSNDEICGSHSYNTKIIDKYATIEVRDKEANITGAERYFFINTFSKDTFKEKTVPVTLTQGQNTIRVYNDDSWEVLWGGTQSLPGENRLKNYTPNFDCFILTPAALDEAVELPTEYAVSVATTSGGYAVSNRNLVQAGGEAMLSIYPEKGIERVLVDGVERTDALVMAAKGVYTLAVSDIQSDVNAFVYFSEGSGEYIDAYITNASFGSGTAAGWQTDGTVHREAANEYEGYFLKLGGGGSLSQQVSAVPAGEYILSVFTKSDAYSEFSGTATLFAGDASVDLLAGSSYAENFVPVTVDEEGLVEIEVTVDDGATGRLCLDTFMLKPKPEIDPDLLSDYLLYFVDAGDHNPETLSAGDRFGQRNSVTDKLYGYDKATGYTWGLVYTEADPAQSPISGSRGVFTQHQWANERNLADGLDKTTSFRYARDQVESGISPRYIRYAFELEPGEYVVEAGFSNVWNNARNPSLYANGALLGTASMSGTSAKQVLTGVAQVPEGENSLLVEVLSTDATINLTYITIAPYREMADLTGLAALYEAVKDTANDPADPYADTAWQAFVLALETAEAILAEQEVPGERQAEVNNALAALQAAFDALVPMSANIDPDILYFVDAGDHDPSTLSGNDKFGIYNRVTDQLFGADAYTGKQWGVYDPLDPDGSQKGNPDASSKGAYTRYTWANENVDFGTADGRDKKVTFRYARGQDNSSAVAQQVGELYVDYRFELEPGAAYDIEVGLGNHWGNASPVSVYANRGGGAEALLAENVAVESSGNRIVTATATAGDDGFMDINVRKAITGGNTINLNYIIIREAAGGEVVDKSALEALVEENKNREQGAAPGEVWEEFRAALEEAQAILLEEDASQERVDASFARLGAAIEALELTGQVDKSALEALYNEYKDKPQGEYTGESWQTLQAALSAAAEVLADEEATQAMVDDALAVLESAIEGLQTEPAPGPDLWDLEFALEYMGGLFTAEDGYRADRYERYANAILAGEAILADPGSYTQAQVDAAAEEIYDAVGAIGPKVGGLEVLMQAARELLEDEGLELTEATRAALLAALDEAVLVWDNPAATQEEVTGVSRLVLAALGELSELGDPTALARLIAAAERLPRNLYTDESLAGLDKALFVARGILAETDPTVDELAVAYTRLLAAIDGLVVKLDYEELDAALDMAALILANADSYVASTIENLGPAYETARGLRDTATTQAQLNAAARDLLAEVAKARLKADLSRLNALIAQAEGLNRARYTLASLAALDEALAAAKRVTENDTQEAANTAANGLSRAIEGLEELPEVVTPPEGGGNEGGNGGNGGIIPPVTPPVVDGNEGGTGNTVDGGNQGGTTEPPADDNGGNSGNGGGNTGNANGNTAAAGGTATPRPRGSLTVPDRTNQTTQAEAPEVQSAEPADETENGPNAGEEDAATEGQAELPSVQAPQAQPVQQAGDATGIAWWMILLIAAGAFGLGGLVMWLAAKRRHTEAQAEEEKKS